METKVEEARNCIECGIPIPKERLEVLPETQTCVNCSKVTAKIAITAWDDLTSELIIIEPEQSDVLSKNLKKKEKKHKKKFSENIEE